MYVSYVFVCHAFVCHSQRPKAVFTRGKRLHSQRPPMRSQRLRSQRLARLAPSAGPTCVNVLMNKSSTVVNAIVSSKAYDAPSPVATGAGARKDRVDDMTGRRRKEAWTGIEGVFRFMILEKGVRGARHPVVLCRRFADGGTKGCTHADCQADCGCRS